MLKQSEYPFIRHDSVMKLNDIRTVSINRVLYHQKSGRIDIYSDEYKLIEELVITKYFPEFLYRLRCLEKRIKELDDKTTESTIQ